MWPFNAQPQPVPWLPTELVQKLFLPAPEELVAAAAGHILVVRLNDFSRDLEVGLSAFSRVEPDNKSEKATLGFSVSTEEATKVSFGRSPEAAPRPSMSADGQAFPHELLSASCFLVSLADRAARGHDMKLSVGRSSSCDIVLRHASVSKLHAHLRVGPELVVSDAGSLNHTLVNGDITAEARVVVDGDVLKFGAVQCVLCTPATLWKAVRRRRA